MEKILSALSSELGILALPYEDFSVSESQLLMEAWDRAWRKIGSFQGGETDEETFAMFRAWVGHIIRRLGINAERDRKRLYRRPGRGKESPPSISPLGTPATGQGEVEDPMDRESITSDRSRALRIQDALMRHPDRVDAGILWLHLFDGLTFEQISERLMMHYNRIRTGYRRAIRLLQQDVDELL